MTTRAKFAGYFGKRQGKGLERACRAVAGLGAMSVERKGDEAGIVPEGAEPSKWRETQQQIAETEFTSRFLPHGAAGAAVVCQWVSELVAAVDAAVRDELLRTARLVVEVYDELAATRSTTVDGAGGGADGAGGAGSTGASASASASDGENERAVLPDMSVTDGGVCVDWAHTSCLDATVSLISNPGEPRCVSTRSAVLEGDAVTPSVIAALVAEVNVRARGAPLSVLERQEAALRALDSGSAADVEELRLSPPGGAASEAASEVARGEAGAGEDGAGAASSPARATLPSSSDAEVWLRGIAEEYAEGDDAYVARHTLEGACLVVHEAAQYGVVLAAEPADGGTVELHVLAVDGDRTTRFPPLQFSGFGVLIFPDGSMYDVMQDRSLAIAGMRMLHAAAAAAPAAAIVVLPPSAVPHGSCSAVWSSGGSDSSVVTTSVLTKLDAHEFCELLAQLDAVDDNALQQFVEGVRTVVRRLAGSAAGCAARSDLFAALRALYPTSSPAGSTASGPGRFSALTCGDCREVSAAAASLLLKLSGLPSTASRVAEDMRDHLTADVVLAHTQALYAIKTGEACLAAKLLSVTPVPAGTAASRSHGGIEPRAWAAVFTSGGATDRSLAAGVFHAVAANNELIWKRPGYFRFHYCGGSGGADVVDLRDVFRSAGAASSRAKPLMQRLSAALPQRSYKVDASRKSLCTLDHTASFCLFSFDAELHYNALAVVRESLQRLGGPGAGRIICSVSA